MFLPVLFNSDFQSELTLAGGFLNAKVATMTIKFSSAELR